MKHMCDEKIASEKDLPKGSTIEGRYGDRIVAIVPCIIQPTVPGTIEHCVSPRFTPFNASVRRVYHVHNR